MYSEQGTRLYTLIMYMKIWFSLYLHQSNYCLSPGSEMYYIGCHCELNDYKWTIDRVDKTGYPTLKMSSNFKLSKVLKRSSDQVTVLPLRHKSDNINYPQVSLLHFSIKPKYFPNMTHMLIPMLLLPRHIISVKKKCIINVF